MVAGLASQNRTHLQKQKPMRNTPTGVGKMNMACINGP